jgi:hypothetical protein
MGVAAINRDLCIALLDNDVVLPITNWIGADGEECEPVESVVCVAGPSLHKHKIGFYTIDLRQFEGAVIQ